MVGLKGQRSLYELLPQCETIDTGLYSQQLMRLLEPKRRNNGGQTEKLSKNGWNYLTENDSFFNNDNTRPQTSLATDVKLIVLWENVNAKK